MGYSPWDHKELDMADQQFHFLLSRATESFALDSFSRMFILIVALDDRESVSFLGQKTDLLALHDLKMFVGSAPQRVLVPQL